jgi:hypothetical protein
MDDLGESVLCLVDIEIVSAKTELLVLKNGTHISAKLQGA